MYYFNGRGHPGYEMNKNIENNLRPIDTDVTNKY